MGPKSQASIAAAINGLTDTIGHLVVELRMQRVTIAKLSAQRVVDKEETQERLEQLGQTVVEQERKVNQLHLVRSAPENRPTPVRPPPPRPRKS